MPSANEYDIGDLIELTANFTDLADAPSFPTSVVCTVRAPSGTTSSPGVTGSGPYTAEIAPNEHGTWWYAFDGGPDVKASGENWFVVRRQEVPR